MSISTCDFLAPDDEDDESEVDLRDLDELLKVEKEMDAQGHLFVSTVSKRS